MQKHILMFGAFILLMAGCSTIQVTSDYDRSVDFTKYKTYSYYGWAHNSDKILNQLDKERIEKAFADEFAKRGLTFEEEGGDLVVALYIVTEQKQETTATTTSFGGGPYYGGYYYGYGPGWGWGGGMSTTSINTYDYTVGTLICDVFDAKEQKLIWEGTGQKTVDNDPSTRDETIPKAVAAIMNEYPVPPVGAKK
ncbi:MAG: DUF4136 domain-containing protein [Bacteroidetes bacterium]|nr:MAG: DUF4136 domain-containing protein [Bacteroidota bacterium]RLD87152.1 MAG: DUF4136 domain-containing protein [Bacteroidota bacterium]